MSAPSPQIEVVERGRLGEVAGAHVADAIARCVAARGRCRLGVAGGSSTPPALRWLADHLDPKLAACLVVTTLDERHLPRGAGGELHADHNLRLLEQAWIHRATTPPTVLSMVRPGSLEQARASYEAGFAELGGLDVLLLAAGPDGHIASLFPDHRGLEQGGLCLAIDDSPKPPSERITVTMDVLNDAEYGVLIAPGAGKAEVLQAAFAGDRRVPLARVAPKRSWRWVLDPESARLLPR